MNTLTWYKQWRYFFKKKRVTKKCTNQNVQIVKKIQLENRTKDRRVKAQNTAKGSIRSVTFSKKSWSLLVNERLMIAVYDRDQLQILYCSVRAFFRGCTTTNIAAL